MVTHLTLTSLAGWELKSRPRCDAGRVVAFGRHHYHRNEAVVAFHLLKAMWDGFPTPRRLSLSTPKPKIILRIIKTD